MCSIDGYCDFSHHVCVKIKAFEQFNIWYERGMEEKFFKNFLFIESKHREIM